MTMNSRLFLMLRTLNFLSVRNYQNLIKSWPPEGLMRKFCNFYAVIPLEARVSCLGRSFRIYSCINQIEVPSGTEQNKSRKSKKKSEGPKVLIIDENGKESAMYLSEAEKYAKKNKLRLIKVENVNGKKEIYKFDKATNVILKETKNKNNCKKFMMRDTIESHDLEIKVNNMYRFIEKGVTVICLIENVSSQNKLNEILQLLKSSKLNEHLSHERSSSKQINLTFKKNAASNKKNIKTQNHIAATTEPESV